MKECVTMKFNVNENCIACGLCTGICPDIFSLESGDEIAQAKDQDVDGEVADKGMEALESCPVNAIEKV